MSRVVLPLSIAPDHAALAGHFPGHPIVPGVVLLDEVLQLIASSACRWQIAVLKFHRVALPGQPLQLEVQSARGGGSSFELHGAQGLIASGTVEPHYDAVVPAGAP